MKKQLSPAVTAAVIFGVLVVVGAIIWMALMRPPEAAAPTNSTMPRTMPNGAPLPPNVP